MRLVLIPCAVLVATACAPAQPFQGPGYNAREGVLTEASGPFVAVVTHAKIKKGEGKAFQAHVDAITAQLDAGQAGYIGRSLKGEIPGRDRWTLTVWEDQQSVDTFFSSPAHLEAMRQTGAVTETVRSTHWMLTPDEMPPTWGDAIEKLEADWPL